MLWFWVSLALMRQATFLNRAYGQFSNIRHFAIQCLLDIDPLALTMSQNIPPFFEQVLAKAGNSILK